MLIPHAFPRSLLFAGLLVNRDTVSRYVDWLHVISFFHAAYEAFAVNELRYLTLKENKARMLSETLKLVLIS